MLRPPRGASVRRRHRRLIPLLCQVWVGAIACDATAPSRAAPPLEAVAFGLIGSGKVMFQRTGDNGGYEAVYVIDADAQSTTAALDTVTSLVFGPSISPAGDEVAWQRWTDEQTCFDVYSTDLTGGSPRRLSALVCNNEGNPSWTPSGSAVVFQGDVFGAAPRIFQRVLASNSLDTLRTFALGVGCPNHFRDLSFGLVSASAGGGLAYSCHTVEIDVALSPSDSLTARYRPDTSNARVYAPAWSPAGDEIAFLEVVRDTGGVILSTSLKVLDVGGGTTRTVATVAGSGRAFWHSANLLSVCWLPGGTRLVFNAPAAGVAGSNLIRANLHVVAADGTGLAQLTTAPDAFDHSVSCSR